MATSDLTIHQVRVFEAVVLHGSIYRAAIALDLPQPSVSRVLGRLETSLGTRLLMRAGSGVILTAAGERFRENARQIMHFHDRAFADVEEVRGRLFGEARVAAPESVGSIIFAPMILRFSNAHPHARLRALSAQSASIPAMLDNGTADIGVIANTHPHPHRTLEPLFSEALHLIGPAGSPHLEEREIRLSAIEGLPLILNAMPGGFRSLIDAAFSSIQAEPDVRVEIDANAPLLELIRDGAGFSILPYSIIAALDHGRGIAASRIVDPAISRKMSVVLAAGRPVTPVWREAVLHLRSVIRDKSEAARWNIASGTD